MPLTKAHKQTKEDKERFFNHLERLCDTDSETESEDERFPINTSHTSRICHSSHKTEKESRPDLVDNYKQERAIREPARTGNTISQTSCAYQKPVPEVIDLVSPSYAPLPPRYISRSSRSPTKQDNKRSRTQNPNTLPRKRSKKSNSKDDVVMVSEEKRIFSGFVFYFVPNDNIAKHRKLRVQRAREHGAQWARCFDHSVTHVIVEHYISFSEAAKAFPNRQIPENVAVVRSTWFSESLSSMYLRDIQQSRFRLIGAPSSPSKKASPIPPLETTSDAKSTRDKSKLMKHFTKPTSPNVSELENIIAQVKTDDLMDHDSEDNASLASTVPETDFDNSSPEAISNRGQHRTYNKGFQCMTASNGKVADNPNASTIAMLQEMATIYDQTGDNWRTTAYRKAIGALRRQTKLISTREEAVAIPQIGGRLADKIETIVQEKSFPQLENMKDDTHIEIQQLFMGIYGVGRAQAMQWMAQGHRMLDDIRQHAELSANQRIGLEHYDDFKQRIPRAEVAKHASIVRCACQVVHKDIQVTVGGSYRRGSTDSGDIDLIITKPDADMSQIRILLAKQVIPALTTSGFLKVALASSHSDSDTGSKWHGASCLPGSSVWRRIDFLFVPWNELGAAMIYFTGNDIFNRSMRLLASKKGMRLNQHGLYKDVMRGKGRVKMTEGSLLESKSEKKIFEILGVPWREPNERQC